MTDALVWHRLQFAFTIVFHYLFPQLTMGLAALIALMKITAAVTKDERWAAAARFWIRVFAVNFAFGVVTGIPMEMQFGTNWSRFTGFAGAVIGHSLGMESLFAFFLESVFLGMLVFGEKKLGPRRHLAVSLLLWLGTWASGFFIVTVNAFMQHPRGHVVRADGTLAMGDFVAYMTNPWALGELAHVLSASLVTASFVVSSVGAYYTLLGRHREHAPLFLRIGVRVGVAASLLVAFPTGDHQAKLVAEHQPVALAAMEGRFETERAAGITLIGQPNVRARRLDNPVVVPAMLSFLAYGTFHSDVRGLAEFPERDWPTNIELLYYSFHLMAGIGTIQIALMAAAAAFELRRRLDRARPLLWALLLAAPLPYIATTAGWLTAELGRQPWLIFGVFRTADGASPRVHSGDALFTLIGFAGIYAVLALLFVVLVGRIVGRGPSAEAEEASHG